MSAVRKSKAFLEMSSELLSRGYRVRFCAEGASMQRTICTGEAITVEPVSPADLKSGDIAMYRSGRGVIAHRVVGIHRENGQAPVFVMRGDAASSADEPVESQQILGKVVAVERRGRSINLTSRRAKMRFLMSTCVCGLRRWLGGACLEGIARGARLLSVLLVLGVFFTGVARAQNKYVVPLVSASGAGTGGATSLSFALDLSSLTSGESTNWLLIGVSYEGVTSGSPDDGRTISSVTWNGTSVSEVSGCEASHKGGTYTNSTEMAIYALQGPANASANVVVTLSGTARIQAGAVVFGDVGSLGTCVTTASAAGSRTSDTVTVTGPGTYGAVFDTVSVKTLGSSMTVSNTGGQTYLWNHTASDVNGYGCASGGCSVGGAASYKLGDVTSMEESYSASSNSAYGAVPLIPASITAVTGSSLTATLSEGGNLIKLQTEREMNNLGFNLYREQNGQRVKLNSSLLAGTALLAGPETALTAGYSHTWWDVPPAGAGGASYWVEEVDLHGQRTWYGPAVPKPAAGNSRSASASVLTAAKGPGLGGRVLMLNQLGRVGAGVSSASHPLQARASAVVTAPRTPVLNPPPTPQQAVQYKLAAGQAVKIGIQSEGWYSVTQAELVAAGFDPNAAVSSLQLFAEGVQQPIYVQGQVGNKLGPTGDIEFYATGLDTTWSLTRVYWLTWGAGAGQQVQTEPFHSGVSSGPPSFPFTVEWQPRTIYFAALLNGDADNFFGPVLASGDPVSQPLTVNHYYSPAAETPQLQMSLQGVSDGPHAVGVALNGYQVGMVTFADQNEGVATLTVPSSTLLAGQNVLTLTVQGGSEDVSLVDTVLLTYPHTYTADSDYLRLTVQGGSQVTIGGFSNSAITVVDVTNPAAVTIVPGGITFQGGSYAITISPQGGGTRTLLALTSAQVGQPSSITANHPSSWHTAQAGYDMVVITHSDFASSLTPLVTLRQGQGRKVAVIDVEDLFDEFNFGEKTPYALKDFLSTAQGQWQLKPHFVLLVGDATFDPKNYLGQGDFDFVPTYMVDTTLLETASDDWFADFSGTGIPQMAVGRFPIRTATDASTLVNKVVSYETSGSPSWTNQVLLVADQNDPGDNFEAYAAAVQALLPASTSVSEILVGSDPTAHSDLLNALNAEGQGLVNYIGHGSEEVWESALFSSTDATGLTNGPMVPFVVSMTCLNGYFQDVYATSLSKALIEAPGGGAVAVWASSGLTNSGSQATLNQALVQAIYGSSPMTLGEAAASAKAAVGDLDVRKTWILFGDPATTIP